MVKRNRTKYTQWSTKHYTENQRSSNTNPSNLWFVDQVRVTYFPMDLMLLISACSITKSVDKPVQNRSLRLTTWSPDLKAASKLGCVCSKSSISCKYTWADLTYKLSRGSQIRKQLLKTFQMKKPMSWPFSGGELTQQINHIHIFNPQFCSAILVKGVFQSLYAFFQSFHSIVFSEFCDRNATIQDFIN